jgi:hypothetical protein
MDCVHHSMSPANNTPHTTAERYLREPSPPLCRRSKKARAATTGKANALLATVAVAGVVSARPNSTAEAETHSAPIAKPMCQRMSVRSIVSI